MNVQSFLHVKDLKIHFPTDDGLVKSVDGLSFSLERGRTLGIVGESGSGKSVTSLGILGLHKGGSARISGEIWLVQLEETSKPPGRTHCSASRFNRVYARTATSTCLRARAKLGGSSTTTSNRGPRATYSASRSNTSRATNS